MPPKKTLRKSPTEIIIENVELKAEIKRIRTSKLASSLTQLASTAIRCGSVVAIFYICYMGIVALAGQTTLAQIGIGILADIKISEALAYLLAGGSVAYGVNQRKLRRDTIEQFSDHTKNLELKADPKRSTSNLTKRGDTNPQDRY